MKANKRVISALLGVALLAVPITAAAHGGDRNRAPVPAYHQVQAYRPVVAPRANFVPRVAENNRLWMTPTSPIVLVHDRDDWRWRDRDGDGWRDRHDRDEYRPVDRDNCRIAPPYNPYPNNYRPGYYPQAYNAPQYFGAPVGGGLANLIYQRDSAVYQYQAALRRGDRVAAKHLHNDIVDLNKRIGGAEQRTGYNPLSYNSYVPSGYNNSYGYGTPNGFTTMLAPLLGNYIH